jgi:hypothetical protein
MTIIYGHIKSNAGTQAYIISLESKGKSYILYIKKNSEVIICQK